LQRVKLYCKCYGGLFFAAKEMHQDTGNAVARTPPRDVISSIADDGIHIMSGWNLTNHVFFKYEDITKWTTATDPDLFAFSINDDMIYFLISDYPRYIEDAVQMYVSSVINRQQGAPLPTRRDSSKLKLTKEEIYGPESTVNWEERISANLHVLLDDDDEEQNDADEGEEEEEGEGEIDDDEDLNMDLSNTNLPEGWEALPDPETGETYYWNEATDETTWDHPNKSAMIAEKKRMRLRMKAMRARRSSAVMVANVSAGGSAEGDIESTSEASPSADTQETSTAAATKTAPKARKKKKGRRASALMAVHMRRSKSNNETTSQDVDDAPTVAGEEEDLSPLPMGGDEEEIEVAEPSQPPPPSSEDLDEFLETLSLSAFADQLRDFGIDHPADLRELVESDLDELGLSKVQRRRLLRKVETL
jgi:hypothetical protein